MIAPDDKQKIEALLAQSALTGPLLARWAQLGLNGHWLCAGAVFQTIWNDLYGLPLEYGIGDMDVIWFNPSQPLGVERLIEKRIAKALPNLPSVDAKNEAHVHRWYKARFGYDIRPYRSVADAVATFPTTVGAIAVQPAPQGLKIIAPFGVDEMMRGHVRANRRQITPAIYKAKVTSWQKRWPQLEVRPWSLGVG